jgi:hypothetical protein
MKQTQSRRTSSSADDDEQFFEALDGDMQSSLRSKGDYVENVNQLNKVFLKGFHKLMKELMLWKDRAVRRRRKDVRRKKEMHGMLTRNE